jgi:hypothetical protein
MPRASLGVLPWEYVGLARKTAQARPSYSAGVPGVTSPVS